MRQNIIIREKGNIEHISNVRKIKTQLEDGSFCYWIPEEEFSNRIIPITITENGEYSLPEGYGYSPVTVEIEDDISKFIDGNVLEYTNSKITRVPVSVFNYNGEWVNINLPNCSYIERSAFELCSSLQSIDLPNCSYIGNSAFYWCSSLQSINLSNCTYIGNDAFYYCISLQSIDLPNCSWIGYSTFYRCSSLSKIILGYSSIVFISEYVFTNSPIVDSNYLGYYGSIYVPVSLIDSYKTARYWSDYSYRITTII